MVFQTLEVVQEIYVLEGYSSFHMFLLFPVIVMLEFVLLRK